MKISKVMRIAFIALLLCVGFAACGKMDNEEPKATEKRLVRLSFEVEKGGYYYTYSYDDDGHLTEAIQNMVIPDMDITYKFKFEWREHSIKVTETYINNRNTASSGNVTKYTMHITDGRVQSITYDDYPSLYKKFEYDASDRIIENGDAMYKGVNVWENDKLISVTQDYGSYYNICTFTYGDSRTINGYSPLVPKIISTDPLFTVHPELAGMKTNQIFISETNTWTDNPDEVYITSYEYELDKDGYISKITSKNKMDENNTGKSVYTFTWK